MSVVGIVLLFDPQTEALAAGHCSRLEKGDLAPGLLPLGKGAIPHMSMCHAEFLPVTLSRVERAVNAIAEEYVRRERRQLSGTLSSIRLYGRWIFWLAARTPELDRLHDAVVDAICPMRDGDVPIHWEMDREQAELRALYGYPAVKAKFVPHVTLGALVEPCAGARRYETEAARYFTARSLALGKIGAYGQLIDVWHEAPLAS